MSASEKNVLCASDQVVFPHQAKKQRKRSSQVSWSRIYKLRTSVTKEQASLSMFEKETHSFLCNGGQI